jgi:biopolymer transport protein ExbD
MRRLESNISEGNVGFQIAPMIDVVFVIMLFFMLMAGSIKVERELNSKLPGVALTTAPTDFMDEVIIGIAPDGGITLNDDAFDSPASTDLPQLKATLMRLKQTSDAAKSPVLITIVSDPQAKYKRTINVLDALSVAGISNVTFTVSDDEQ